MLQTAADKDEVANPHSKPRHAAYANKANMEYGAVSVDYKKSMRGCIVGKNGFLKIIYSKPAGTVIGVHMFGDNAADHISFGADLVQDGTSVYKLQKFIFPACTFHE